MDPSGLRFELIYLDDMIYGRLICYKFTLVHEGVLVIMQGCTKDSKQGL